MATAHFERLHPELEVTYLRPEKPAGLVVVITGHGKGKTSSALGMVLRACGHDMKTCIVQFMKGDLYTGEWDGIRKLDCAIELYPTGMGFCGIQGNPFTHAQHREAAQKALRLAMEKMDSNRYDMVILDEVNNALKLNLVDLQQVLDLIRRKPPGTHLILTGRDAHADVIDAADTVSEVQEIKHAYRKNIEPQPGVDY